MGAQRAAWHAALDSESAALTGDDHVQSLHDLVEAFETVPHDVLIAAAKKVASSGFLLQLTCRSGCSASKDSSPGNPSKQWHNCCIWFRHL